MANSKGFDDREIITVVSTISRVVQGLLPALLLSRTLLCLIHGFDKSIIEKLDEGSD